MNNRETIMNSHGQKNIRQCHLPKLPDLPASSCKPRVLVILDLNKNPNHPVPLPLPASLAPELSCCSVDSWRLVVGDLKSRDWEVGTRWRTSGLTYVPCFSMEPIKFRPVTIQPDALLWHTASVSHYLFDVMRLFLQQLKRKHLGSGVVMLWAISVWCLAVYIPTGPNNE